VSTADERLRMAESIVNFEARRDAQGHLRIYKLPAGDGGGTYEVAGINDRYHPTEAAQLAALINAGRYDDAEKEAQEIIATYTDFVMRWTNVAAVECYLRDTGFNRGPRGAARILQRAIGVPDSGSLSANDIASVKQAQPDSLLKSLRQARESYEREVAHRDESSPFWKGLVNRWNKALAFARTFLPAAASAAPGLAADSPQEDAPFSASEAVVAEAISNTSQPVPGAPPMAAFSSAPTLLPVQSTVSIAALRQGSQGDMVRAWQSFLTGQGFDPGGLDGVFGDKTAVATKAFQSKCGIASDGIAGRQTILKAMGLGFELIEEPASDTSGSNFPPRPDFPPLEDTAARQALFGKYAYVAAPEPGNRENIRILGSWEQDNIISVPLPQLRKAIGPAAPSGMSFHRLAARQLTGMWADWEAAGLLDRILSFDGSFNARFIRGSTTSLSNHAFGTAFDINAAENTLGTRPPLVGQRGSTRELVPIANKWGFYWGGHFGSRPDGMHFEIAFLK
jgi:peptidoglycan hydrolase-like protein with peptidoglycan-binding domain